MNSQNLRAPALSFPALKMRGLSRQLVSDQKTQERQICRLALYDPLTELPNRVLLTTRLTEGMILATENLRPLAVAMIDLDGFKQLNDQHGREVGDELLVKLAGRVRSSLRDSDIIGRLGGDEFAIVLADLARADSAGELLQELLRLIAQPFQAEQHELRLSASNGYTLFPQRELLARLQRVIDGKI